MPILVALIFVPVAFAAWLLLFRGATGHGFARAIGLAGALATLCVALAVMQEFKTAPASSQIVHPRMELRSTWWVWELKSDTVVKKTIRLESYLGLDGVSLSLVLLTTVLTCSAVLISWESIKDRAAEFYSCLLLLEAGLIGVFCSFDIIQFYVFFEFTLLPLFFLVGVFGGPQRKYAAVKFFLYTLAGSLITLLGISAIVWEGISRGLTTPFSIPDLAESLSRVPLNPRMQTPIFLAIAAGFMVKVPLFPFHTWLPLAHVEAPTAGSVMLAGVLLKLGTYGFFRLCLPLVPMACRGTGIPLIGWMAIIGILYGSLCSLAQRDIKKLIAYSSVAHLGFCMLGMFALNQEGVAGSVFQMINHGLSTGALFILVGMVYDRYHTRRLDDLGGLAARLPLITVAMVFIAMASIGLPGLNGFVGEMLSLIGMYKQHPLYAALGATGVVLGAWYLLTMVQLGFFGTLREPELHGHGHEGHSHSHATSDHGQSAHGHDAHGHGAVPALPDNGIRDMNFREFLAVFPLAALCLWIGVCPQPFMNLIRPDVETVVRCCEAPRSTTPIERVAATYK